MPMVRQLPETLEEYLPIFAHEFTGIRQRVIDAGIVTEEEYPEVCVQYFRWHLMIDRNKNMGMYSEKIDAVLHQHVLHTPDYIAFCDKYFGHFHHHVPAPYPYPEGHKEARMAGYEKFKEDYRAQFGDLPPVIWGPQDSKACCGGHHNGIM